MDVENDYKSITFKSDGQKIIAVTEGEHEKIIAISVTIPWADAMVVCLNEANLIIKYIEEEGE